MNIEDCVTREDFRARAIELMNDENAIEEHGSWIAFSIEALTAAVLSLQAPRASDGAVPKEQTLVYAETGAEVPIGHVAPETGTQQDDHWLQCTKCMPQHEHGCPMEPGSTPGRGADARVVVLRDGHHSPLPGPDFIPLAFRNDEFACPECGAVDRHAPTCVSRPPLADPYSA